MPLPPDSPPVQLRWFATARVVSLAVKIAALGVFAFLLTKVILGGGI